MAKYIFGIKAVLRIGWLYGTYHCLPEPVPSLQKTVVNLEPWITSRMKQNILGVFSWCVQWHISISSWAAQIFLQKYLSDLHAIPCHNVLHLPRTSFPKPCLHRHKFRDRRALWRTVPSCCWNLTAARRHPGELRHLGVISENNQRSLTSLIIKEIHPRRNIAGTWKYTIGIRKWSFKPSLSRFYVRFWGCKPGFE